MLNERDAPLVRQGQEENEMNDMYEYPTFLQYEVAYRRERMMEAATGHKARRTRLPWAARPARRGQR